MFRLGYANILEFWCTQLVDSELIRSERLTNRISMYWGCNVLDYFGSIITETAFKNLFFFFLGRRKDFPQGSLHLKMSFLFKTKKKKKKFGNSFVMDD